MKLSKAQKELKKSLIVAVHLSQRYKNYYKDNKDEYIELLQKHFGVKSSKDLSISELIELKEYLNFKRESLSTKELITKPQLKLIRELWEKKARDKSERALIWFLKKFEGELKIRQEFFSKRAATKAIIALRKMRDIDDNNL